MQRNYPSKKKSLDNMLTIYGRKAVLEALQDSSIRLHKVHLAKSNKTADTIDQIVEQAKRRNIDIQYHSKLELSRISKNSKQDQGVAADILCQQHQDYRDFIAARDVAAKDNRSNNTPCQLLAVDGVTNPQNLGMIIRSVCAGNLQGILLPAVGSAAIGPLVIKASTGTVFKTPVIRCHKLVEALTLFQAHETEICILSSHAKHSLFEPLPEKDRIFVLGNESEGVSQEVSQLADRSLVIPMANNVESLNVAVTAALIAFRSNLIVAREAAQD